MKKRPISPEILNPTIEVILAGTGFYGIAYWLGFSRYSWVSISQILFGAML